MLLWAKRRKPSDVLINKNKEAILSTKLWHYALPLGPLAVMGWVSGQADRYLIGHLLDVGQVGLYAALYGITSRPLLMAGATLEMTVRQTYYQAISSNETKRSGTLFRMWLGGAALVAVGGIVLFGLFHRPIAALLVAEPYRSGSAMMPWIALGYGILLIAQVYERVCYAHQDTKTVFLIGTTGAVASLAVAVPSIQHFGLLGAAYAVPIAYALQLFIAMWCASRAARSHTAQLHLPGLSTWIEA